MPETREYRVVSGTVHKREDVEGESLGDLVGYGPGETVELRPEVAEGFEVRPVEDEDDTEAESDTESDSSVETADATETDDEASVTVDGTQSDDESDAADEADDDEADEALTAEVVENAEYEDLRSFARDYEDVNGNWGEDRLRAELAEKAE